MHAVDRYVTRPDDSRVDGPGIFERAVLRQRGAVLDSIVVETISQDFGGIKVRRFPAIAGVDALFVADGVVYLDIELVVRCMGRRGEIQIEELGSVRGFRIEIDDGLTDRVNLVLWNYVAGNLWPYASRGRAGGLRRIVDGRRRRRGSRQFVPPTWARKRG